MPRTNGIFCGRRSRVVLAPRCWRQACDDVRITRATVANKPGHRGEREVSRKPLRREGRDASARPVVPAPCIFFARGPWVLAKHPAFPAPSVFRGTLQAAKLGRGASRGCGGVSPRHCERSEAIQNASPERFWEDLDCSHGDGVCQGGQRFLFGFDPRFEPVLAIWFVCQIKLTFGRHARRLHQDSACDG